MKIRVDVDAVQQGGVMTPRAVGGIRRFERGDAGDVYRAGFGDDKLLMLEILIAVLVNQQAEPLDAVGEAPGIHRGFDDGIDPGEILLRCWSQ